MKSLPATATFLFAVVNVFVVSGREFCKVVDNINYNKKYDQAVLFINTSKTTVTVSGIPESCYECDVQHCGSGDDLYVAIDTTYPYKLVVQPINNKIPKSKTFRKTFHFTDNSIYSLHLDVQNGTWGDISIIERDELAWIPLPALLGGLAVLLLIYIIGNTIWECAKNRKNRNYRSDDVAVPEPLDASAESKFGGPSITSVSAPDPPVKKARIKSLDTFRGIAITIMIFVNYGGGNYVWFVHAPWNGLTVADLVFPWFIFAMGSSIFISTRSLKRKGKSRMNITKKILVRSAKLMMLGLFLNNGRDYNNWRVPGVLQRFSISFFVVSMLNVWLGPSDDPDMIDHHYDWRDSFRDIFFYPFQHIIMVMLLVAHAVISFTIYDPDHPECKSYLGPGGLAQGGKYVNCTGGAAAYIDRLVFTSHHIYQHPECQSLYKCSAHDPEGLLGILTSIFLTYMGLQASRILFLYDSHGSHVKRWLFWLIVWAGLAVGLCGASIDDGVIPINKNLWSVSFVFATGALGYLLLTICYVLVDVKKWWDGAPFYFAGMNAIFLYVAHEILGEYFPFNFVNDGKHIELLIRSAVGTAIWILVSYKLFREKTFYKL